MIEATTKIPVRTETVLSRTIRRLSAPSAVRPPVARQSIPVNILSDKHGEICHEFIIPPRSREGECHSGHTGLTLRKAQPPPPPSPSQSSKFEFVVSS